MIQPPRYYTATNTTLTFLHQPSFLISSTNFYLSERERERESLSLNKCCDMKYFQVSGGEGSNILILLGRVKISKYIWPIFSVERLHSLVWRVFPMSHLSFSPSDWPALASAIASLAQVPSFGLLDREMTKNRKFSRWRNPRVYSFMMTLLSCNLATEAEQEEL